MANKELRKLSRPELLELLVEVGRENLSLKDRLAKAEAELNDRRIRTEQSGSLAEAALKLNGVFEAAQSAIDQYRENVEHECALKIAEAEKKAAEILAAAAAGGKEAAE